MFHTLFDYQDQNIANNKQIQKIKYNGLNKNIFTNQNYYGKGNKVYEYYNKNENNNENNENENEKFEKTKNKVKLIVYKNGFILDNGPFRDKSIKENEEFLEQVGRGVIPHEIADQGINDLGILLINRKTDIYPSSNLHKRINSFNNFDFFKYPFQKIETNQYKINQPISNNINIIPLGKVRTNSSKNIQNMSKIIDLTQYKGKKFTRKNCSEPKKNEKEKKFTAFSGSGKLIRNINTKGLCVNKDIKTIANIYQPICRINIRLFNGEIIKCEFNYSQTLRDIYYYVRKISGSNNFYLLDGFPPKSLRDYDRTIWELGLQNSLLTQKIN